MQTPQTFNLAGFGQALRPKTGKNNHTDRILANLSTSNYGTHPNETGAIGRDSFSVTGLISELLSPACGMTEEEKQAYLAKIRAKLERGEKLTPEEMRFLQAEDPILYQQAARVMAMRDSLENQLKSCTSKEEAETVFSTAAAGISKDDPMKGCILAAYNKVMEEFRESDEYQELPDTNEERDRRKSHG